MKITLLGTGTSIGVPELLCDCPVCTSRDPRDKRQRCSAFIETNAGDNILIDCSPDFRAQAFAANIQRIDGVLITHEHYDHVGGIDDLRPYTRERTLNLYANEHTVNATRKRLPYCFAENPYPGVPNIKMEVVSADTALSIGQSEILPLLVYHGDMAILGYRIDEMAYITDCSTLPDESLNALRGVRTLIINALHFKPHTTHQSLTEALELISEVQLIAPLEAAYLIHFSHRIGLHEETQKLLPPNVYLGYDNLQITI